MTSSAKGVSSKAEASRFDGLPASIHASGVLRGRDLSGPQQLEADVVIVGSGASGAVVAATLAAAGQRVIVVEEGPYIPAADHAAMRTSMSMRNAWRDGGMTAALGVGKTPLINVTMGRAVGGSSMLTGGVCFRTPGYVLNRWVKEHGLVGLDETSMRPWFEQVEHDIHVEEVPVHMQSRATTLWGEGARKMGGELTPNRRNTRGCTGCSQCNFGCPHGAKLSVDMTYLPAALRDGATILSDCLVNRVISHRGRAAGIEGRLLNGRNGKAKDRVTVRARRVVLAASAAFTPMILQRSGIAKRSKVLGKNMTLHPSFRMIARFDSPVDGWKGAMQSAHSTSWENEGITLMSVFTPPSVVISGVPGVGPDFMQRAGSLRNLAMFGGMIHDEGGGRVVRMPGRDPLMLYKMSPKDRVSLARLVQVLGEAYLEAGAKELYLPILGHAPVSADEFRRLDLSRVSPSRYECSSQHPLGTTRMGTDARHAVVDVDAEVFDMNGLFVVDGGTLPTSLGVNPQLSIMAMALRFAHKMLDKPLPPAQ